MIRLDVCGEAARRPTDPLPRSPGCPAAHGYDLGHAESRMVVVAVAAGNPGQAGEPAGRPEATSPSQSREADASTTTPLTSGIVLVRSVI